MPGPTPRLTPATSLLHDVCASVPHWEYGALGSDNALRLVSGAMQAPATGPVPEQGARMADFAWQDSPLDARLARVAHSVRRGRAGCSKDTAAACLAAWCRVPDKTQDVSLALEALSTEQLADALPPLLAHPEHGGFWLDYGLRRCLQTAENQDLCRHLLDSLSRTAPEADCPGLVARLWAQWVLVHGSAEEALMALAAPMPEFFLWRMLRTAHCLERLGQREEGVALLRRVWASCPCHPNIILALHDMAFPLPQPSVDDLRRKAPLLALYSWNKAAMLDQTLHSLYATEAAGLPLLVLDNGSTDTTVTLLRAWRDRWGEALRVITLPVNIGAPGARNWLLAQPETRQRGEILFLDDDLILEPGWLSHMSAAALHRPHAAVLGCRIVDSVAPYAVQCGDFFLLPEGDRSFLDLEEHFFIHSNSMGSLDSQLTQYTRPCLSVSGCCHWLRLDAMAPLDFDIRFTPSQFDDLDRDIRCILAGREVIYTGQARIRHVQHSSLRQAHSRQRSAHIFGNKIKLEFLHTESRARKARLAAQDRARQDLLCKISRIAALETT